MRPATSSPIPTSAPPQMKCAAVCTDGCARPKTRLLSVPLPRRRAPPPTIPTVCRQRSRSSLYNIWEVDSMYENVSPIGNLVDLYFDGAFSRRELVRRVAGHTGGIAAAAAVLASMGVVEAQQLSCASDVRVPADAPDLITQVLQFPGIAGPLFASRAQPRTAD